ncbi:MAG: hypothetical protein ACRDFS_05955 [Chloroflexota bacterium]
MYQAPEFEKIGSVGAFTLGSTHPFPGSKANNSITDSYTSPGNPATYGNPCYNSGGTEVPC